MLLVNGKTVSSPDTIESRKDYYVLPGAEVKLITVTLTGKQFDVLATYTENGESVTTSWSEAEKATITWIAQTNTTFTIAIKAI